MPVQGRQHSKLPLGSVMHVRDKEHPVETPDVEQFSPEFVAAGLLQLREALGRLARMTENRSNPVDEYNTATLTGGVGQTAVVNLLPTYDQMNEKIIAVLVAGPPTSIVQAAAQNQIPLGASGVASYNNNNVPIVLNIAGGTVSAVAINGVNTGQTSGFFNVPAYGSVTVTYTVAPTTFFSIGVPAPVPNVVTLVLGDRQWQITMPAAGIIPLGPLGIILGRNDPRQLIASTPGAYYLELMGWADRRYNI